MRKSQSLSRSVRHALLAGVVVLGLAAGQASAATPAAPSNPTVTGKKKVKPGVIYIHTKRLTTCTSWGKDKNWCKDNAQ
jgi:hypothetical protein